MASSLSCPHERWNPCCSCLFSAVPDDVMQHNLFAYLDVPSLLAASTVCSRWNFIAEHPSLWTQLQISSGMAVPASGVGLSRLLSKQSRAVHSLVVRDVRVESCADEHALSGLRLAKLTRLDIAGSLQQNADTVRAMVTAHASTLKAINLSGVASLTDAAVHDILTACTQLEEVSLAGCVQLTDAIFQSFITSGAAARLTRVNLNSCRGLTARALLSLLASVQRGALVSLEVRGVRGICDETLFAIAAAAPHGLQVLDIGNSDPFAAQLRFGAASTARIAMEAGVPLPSTTHVTDVGVRALGKACLHALTTFAAQGHAAVSDDAWAHAVAGMPNLHSLSLRGARGAGAATVATVAACLPSLSVLHLFGCVSLTDADLIPLHAATRLAELDLYGCRGLTAQGIQQLAWACAQPRGALRKLSCGGNPSLRALMAAHTCGTACTVHTLPSSAQPHAPGVSAGGEAGGEAGGGNGAAAGGAAAGAAAAVTAVPTPVTVLAQSGVSSDPSVDSSTALLAKTAAGGAAVCAAATPAGGDCAAQRSVLVTHVTARSVDLTPLFPATLSVTMT